MRHIIIGTAGHVDHGKTTLVKTLTGIDTDRLEEEKRRGISIELGFAHLDLTPEIRLGFVDVPGHERFVKNMLAGASGIDLVLLVIASDECIKPQTVEHFEICRLLGVRHGLIALTKADLATEDQIELAQLEIDAFLAGSFLEGAPIVPVSATTGRGIAELRAALECAAAKVDEKDSKGFPCLPIDRAFSMKGQGAVVTGTLRSGIIRLHDELQLYPSETRVRVRGLQVHSTPVEQARAGERTAVNLGGVDVSQLRRGMTLATPGAFRATRQIDCVVELLSSAAPLKHRAPVHFHAGTAEVEAQARLMSSMEPVQSGVESRLRLLLSDQLLLLPGDRFIIRRFSPVATIGGGVVVDIAAPPRLRRADLDRRTSALSSASSADRIALLVREAAIGLSLGELVAHTGLLPEEIRAIVGAGSFLYLRDSLEWIADRAWSEQLLQRMRQALSEFHARQPLQPGMRKEKLRTQLLPAAPAFLFDALLPLAGDIVVEAEFLRLASHRLAFKADEQNALGCIESIFRQARFAVPSEREVLAKSGINPERARQLLQILLRDRKLVRVSADLIFHNAVLDELRQSLRKRKGQRFSVSDFKDWTNISRKYAIPLLEFLDRERVTHREGDLRAVN